MNRRRVLAFGAVLLLLSPLAFLWAYAATARWLLSGPKLRELINVRPKDFQLDYDAAASIWPGSATFRNLRLRGSDPNVQWFATISDVEVEFSILALLKRTIRCTDVRGTGLAFSLRGKLAPADAASAGASLLPPIPGFADPPLKSPEDVFFVDPKAWSVDIRHVAISRFEDLWVNGIRYRGKARVEGGFFLQPLYLARIDAAALRLGQGELQIAKARGFSLSGSVTALSKPFAPLRSPMPGALREFSATAKLDLRATRLETLQGVVALPDGLRLEAGTATSTIDATLREGIVNGKLEVTVRNGLARLPRYHLSGQASLAVPIRRWDILKTGCDVSGASIALTDVHSSGADEARGWWGRVQIPSGRIGATAYAKAAIQCRDARPLLALIGVDLPGWTNGLVKLDDFSATAAVAAGPAMLRVKDFEANGGGFRIQGDFAHVGAASNGAFLVEKGILILGVDITPKKTAVRPLFARQWYEKKKEERAAGGE